MKLEEAVIKRNAVLELFNAEKFDQLREVTEKLQTEDLDKETLEKSKLGVEFNKIRKKLIEVNGAREVLGAITALLLKWKDVILGGGKSTTESKRPASARGFDEDANNSNNDNSLLATSVDSKRLCGANITNESTSSLLRNYQIDDSKTGDGDDKDGNIGKVDKTEEIDQADKADSPTKVNRTDALPSSTKHLKGPKSNPNDNLRGKFLTGETTRDKCLGMLVTALTMDSPSGTEPDELVLSTCRSIEVCLFEEFSQQTSTAYKTKFRSRYLNLKDKGNHHLREALLSGALTPERFCSMNSAELASEERRREDKLLMEQNLKSARAAQDGEAETDQFRCGRCGQRKTKYYQLQTRSADEPMTTFVTCINCGNRWKFC